MKVRNGFVSNSSSSSFLLIGERIAVEDAPLLIDKGENIIFIGGDLGDGKDVIENITNEHVKFISKHMDIYSYALYKPWLSNNSEGWDEGISVELLKKTINNIPDDINEIEIFRIRKDYHCHDDINEFKDYYRDCDRGWWEEDEEDH